jgi:hypothetical protein
MLLRHAVVVDGVVSGLCGALAILAAHPLAGVLGIPAPAVLVALGAGLLAYALALVLGARHAGALPAVARAAVALNAAWVLGSVALIEAGLLTTAGNWLVAAVAAAVLTFAAAQLRGPRQARRAA